MAWLVALIPAALLLVGGHRGNHAARSLLIPGLGLAEARPFAAIACGAAVVAGVIAWLRWGVDWLVVALIGATMAASAAWGTSVHDDSAITSTRMAHEFPIVIAIVGAVGWVRVTLGGVPGFRWMRGRRSASDVVIPLAKLAPVPRCQAAAVLALAGESPDDTLAVACSADVAQRARRVGLAARARRSPDPFVTDHAAARATRALSGVMDAAESARFLDDCRRSPVGAPAREPTWVRPLDATLAAVAASKLDDTSATHRRWAAALNGPLAVRRGHRPAWWWTPLGVSAGRCLDWEHAAATAIAHAHGWIDAADWPVLRQRVLGAAARGVARRDDERLIAAGRMWLALVDDPDAARIINRPTVRHDPLARAFDTYASTLTERPATIVPPTGEPT